jgi:hypothetical protein
MTCPLVAGPLDELDGARITQDRVPVPIHVNRGRGDGERAAASRIASGISEVSMTMPRLSPRSEALRDRAATEAAGVEAERPARKCGAGGVSALPCKFAPTPHD